jgi:predicted RNA-binding protein with PIN domain
MKYLIVDGYNIINSWQELKPDNKPLEDSRDELINVLAEHSAVTGIQTVVVFDAHRVKDSNGLSFNINGVEVVYTKAGETADSYIERLVYLLKGSAAVQVATSDWAEQLTVLAHGASRISARELREDVMAVLSRVKVKINTLDKQPPPLGSRIHKKTREALEKWRQGGD